MEPIEVGSAGVQLLDQATMDGLRGTFKGSLLLPKDESYDAARTLWNLAIDRRPTLIARCTDSGDVVAAVNFARANQLEVSVRGGGHSVAGYAVCDGGLMIDLSPMKQIRVDSVRRTALVEPGVTWTELDSATQAYGLATPGGTVGETGIAGLTLGGGVGWLMALYGLTCDNLLSAEVVLADGRVVTASESENEDLYRALRGGGGNFGIVTSFEYRLHPVGPIIGGIVAFPIEQAEAVLKFYRQYSASGQDELTVYAIFAPSEDGTPVVLLFACWFGAPEQADKVFAPIRQSGTPLMDTIQPISYLEVQALLSTVSGFHRYWKSGYFTELSDEMLAQALGHFALKNSPNGVMALFRLHGAGARVAADATAFYHRRPQWELNFVTEWKPPENAADHIDWVRSSWQAVAPFSHGVYINHMDKDDNPRVRLAYGMNYERLAAIKAKYDPQNFFRMNHNIPPVVA